MKTQNSDFKSIGHAARVLGVPVAWLRREAHAGRVPALRVGRRVLVNLDRAREALARRAEEGGDA